MRRLEAELGGLLVHPADKTFGTVGRHARQGTCSRVVRRNQQQVQQVVSRHPVGRAQVRRRGLKHVAALDRDRLTEVGVVLEKHGRRHHFCDAGNRALILGVRLPEHLVRFRVVDNGGGGTDIRNDVAAGVHFEARQDRLGHFPRRRGGTRLCELDLPRPGSLRRVDGTRRSCLRRCHPSRTSLRGGGVSRRDADTDENQERKRTNPEQSCSIHSRSTRRKLTDGGTSF